MTTSEIELLRNHLQQRPTATIGRGDRNRALVEALQAILIADGSLPEFNAQGQSNQDGKFFGETEKAVRAYQKKHGIVPQTGKFGAQELATFERLQRYVYSSGPQGGTIIEGLDAVRLNAAAHEAWRSQTPAPPSSSPSGSTREIPPRPDVKHPPGGKEQLAAGIEQIKKYGSASLPPLPGDLITPPPTPPVAGQQTGGDRGRGGNSHPPRSSAPPITYDHGN